MLPSVRRCWGGVKQSRAFQIMLSFMAVLPLFDIITDYAFVIVSFGSDKESKINKLQQTVTTTI